MSYEYTPPTFNTIGYKSGHVQVKTMGNPCTETIIKVADLSGQTLDRVVATCEAKTYTCKFSPSKKWSQGGPIIERELIQLEPVFISAGYEHPVGQWVWTAYLLGPDNIDDSFEQTGDTPLIAAMRCFVASRLGDSVTVQARLL